ncbi:membrane protein, putative [Burkholderia thailandensis E264]|uniref:Membrane protein, putative n=2 Tax=Burkholderia thailandensis TaxID=57975 RepID=Q2T4E8_BURTA|nr:membrane protein, putative [Burkholderia thailandensis E264]
MRSLERETAGIGRRAASRWACASRFGACKRRRQVAREAGAAGGGMRGRATQARSRARRSIAKGAMPAPPRTRRTTVRRMQTRAACGVRCTAAYAGSTDNKISPPGDMFMLVLILGLVIFLGTHSIRLVAGDWRAAQIAALGEPRWKGMYALASVVGFALIVWGYGLARADTASLWFPPIGIRHLTALLTAIAFVLLVAAYVPGTRIKALVGHPMLAGVMVWAGAHLLANGTLHAELLFAVFFVWAFVDFIASRARDRRDGVRYPAGSPVRDGIAIVVGLAAWALFAFVLHGWLIGVRPFA